MYKYIVRRFGGESGLCGGRIKDIERIEGYSSYRI